MNNKTTTREEMLKECIEYAESHGWISGIKDEHLDQWIELDRYYVVIFSQPFCKAVYGEEMKRLHPRNPYKYKDDWMGCEDPYVCCLTNAEEPMWQFHIQQMAVAYDPLLYMFNYIKNERK